MQRYAVVPPAHTCLHPYPPQKSLPPVCCLQDPVACNPGVKLTSDSRFPGAAYKACSPGTEGGALPTLRTLLRTNNRIYLFYTYLRESNLTSVQAQNITGEVRCQPLPCLSMFSYSRPKKSAHRQYAHRASADRSSSSCRCLRQRPKGCMTAWRQRV